MTQYEFEFRSGRIRIAWENSLPDNLYSEGIVAFRYDLEDDLRKSTKYIHENMTGKMFWTIIWIESGNNAKGVVQLMLKLG